MPAWAKEGEQAQKGEQAVQRTARLERQAALVYRPADLVHAQVKAPLEPDLASAGKKRAPRKRVLAAGIDLLDLQKRKRVEADLSAA